MSIQSALMRGIGCVPGNVAESTKNASKLLQVIDVWENRLYNASEIKHERGVQALPQSDERVSDTKLRILTAAITCFSSAGYKGCTTRQIADHAGVNESTIFRVFGNKKSLMLEAFYMLTPGPEDVDMSLLTFGKDVEKDLRLLIWNYAMLHLPHMPAYRLSLNVDLVYDREVYYRSFSKIEGLISHMAIYLGQLHAQGFIINADFLALSEYVNGLVLTKATEFLIAEDTLDEVDRFAADYASLLAAYLRPEGEDNREKKTA